MRFIIPVTIYLFGNLNGFSQVKDSASSYKDSAQLIKDSASSGKIVLPWFVERFKISAGAFYVVNKTNVRVQGNGSTGTDIDMEKDVGINREITTFIANFQWQISRRSRVSLNYYSVYRNGNHTLDKDIIFDDNTYYANSNVHTFFNTSLYQVSYGYAILSKPTYEAGVFIGTHIVNTKTGISINGNNTGSSAQNNFGFTAPLPDLGIWGGWAISKRFAAIADISYFGLTLGNKTGRLLAFNLNFTFKLIDQLDLTLGYTGLDFKVDVVRPDVTGNFKWGYNGPTLAASFSFGKKSWTH